MNIKEATILPFLLLTFLCNYVFASTESCKLPTDCSLGFPVCHEKLCRKLCYDSTTDCYNGMKCCQQSYDIYICMDKCEGKQIDTRDGSESEDDANKTMWIFIMVMIFGAVIIGSCMIWGCWTNYERHVQNERSAPFLPPSYSDPPAYTP